MSPPTMPELVLTAVATAKETGSILDVERTARRIAKASGIAGPLDSIADALLREGVRQRVVIDMNHPKPSAGSVPERTASVDVPEMLPA